MKKFYVDSLLVMNQISSKGSIVVQEYGKTREPTAEELRELVSVYNDYLTNKLFPNPRKIW